MNRVVGWNNFQKLLGSERSRLGRAPMVLLRSDENDKTIGLVQFHFQMKNNLNTVFSDITGLPKLSDLKRANDLARRVGAKTVVAVGSIGAMGLGSAMDAEHLIMVPTTYEACLFAGAKSALIFDEDEEQFVPKPAMASTRSVVHLDESSFKGEGRNEAIQAALSVVLDRMECADPVVLGILQSSSHDDIITFMHEASVSISFGDGDEVRSVPLAVVAALLPTCFPESSVSRLMASLGRGYGDLLGLNLPDVFPNAVTNQSLDDMLKKLHSSARLWNCLDASDDKYRAVLVNHSLL